MPIPSVYLEAEWADGRFDTLLTALTVGELEEHAFRYLPLREPPDPRLQHIRSLRVRESHSHESVRLLDALPRP